MTNLPAGPPGPHDFTTEICPHCDQPQWPSRFDEHVATAHANIPPCTAALDDEHYDGTLHCVLRAWHRSGHGEYGDYHVSKPGPNGRTVWNDTAPDATPHADYEALKTRWLKLHGNPHAAHHVTELKPHPTEEPQ